MTALEMVCLCMLKVNNSGDFNLKCFKVNLVCYDKALLVLHTRFLSYERFFKGGKMVVYPISPSPPTPMLTKNWKEDQILWVLKSFLPTKTFTEEISLSNYKCIFSKPLLHLEFAKSSAMLAIRAKVVYVSTCQNRANFLLLRANVPTC